MERNCRYDPLVQKLGRMKSNSRVAEVTMGEVMDACHKHASTDKTKDENEEQKGKINTPNVSKPSKGSR